MMDMYPPMAMQQDSTTTATTSTPRYMLDQEIHKWMFTNTAVLKEIEMKFRGQVYDRESRKLIQVHKPLANDYGINLILTILNPFTSTIFSFSNFKEKQIHQIMEQLMQDVITTIGTEAEELGIEENHLSLVKRIIEETINGTLQKAEEGLSLGFLRDTQRTVETIGGKKGGGPLGIFKMFGGGK